MKNITKQYQDLLEGKMSKDNFMRTVRREFPQWVSPVNSFNDAVNILKSKRILSEVSVKEDIQNQDMWMAGFETAINGMDHLSPQDKAIAKKAMDHVNPMKDYGDMDSAEAAYEFVSDLGIGNDEDAETDAMIAQMQRPGEFDPNNPGKYSTLENTSKLKETVSLEPELEAALKKLDKQDKKSLIFWLKDKLAGKKTEPAASTAKPEDPYHTGQFEPHQFGGVFEKEALKEAAEKPEGRYKQATGKAEYDKFAEMDRVNYRQLMKGTEYELLKMPEITDENLAKAKKKAYNNLIKNPKAYMDLLVKNEKEVEKRDKDLRMQPVKSDNHADKANAMKVIKKDEGTNTQATLGNREKAKGMPEGVKVMKESLVRALKEDITNEMLELGSRKQNFGKGQQVKTPDGEVGTVLEETPDSTITVEMEDGTKKDYQAGVLKAYEAKHAMQEFEYGDESDYVSGSDIADEAVQEIIDSIEGTTYTKQQLELAFNDISYKYGQGASDEDFQDAILALGKKGYKMVTSEMEEPMGASEADFENLMKKYDWYAEMSDDPRKWDAQQSMERQLKSIAKSIGSSVAAQIWNKYAPKNRQVDQGYFEDKHAALKERLMGALKKKMKEGAVATSAAGATVASGRNPSDVLKTAKELEKQTGDQLTVVDTKTGKKTQA